jgi:branched-chain amino acid transport system ATP-binding protein
VSPTDGAAAPAAPVAPVAPAAPVLEVRSVRLNYGGLTALSNVDLSIPAGQVTGLIGPNGAGKTSLFDVVTGLVRPSGGRVFLAGRDVTRAGPARRARLGLGRTFQRLELFASLTVRENVCVAAEAAHRCRVRPRRWHLFDSEASDVADRQLAKVGLADLAHKRVDTLSTGTARLVEVARALAGSPRVLLLDEPASGLDADETARLSEVLAELAADGLAVLLVEHDVELVMAACATVTVLERGTVIASGPPEDVRQMPVVRQAYLGTS